MKLAQRSPIKGHSRPLHFRHSDTHIRNIAVDSGMILTSRKIIELFMLWNFAGKMVQSTNNSSSCPNAKNRVASSGPELDTADQAR